MLRGMNTRPISTSSPSPSCRIKNTNIYTFNDNNKTLINMATTCGGVEIIDFWANGFGMRIRIALEEKGIAYQYKEEDLNNPQRSRLVLEMNPVRKSVPILVHEGRPVCDSVAILEYIDEVWKDGFPLLLPKDPYERATARFWTHFIDNKVSYFFSIIRVVKMYRTHGPAQTRLAVGGLGL